jgi:hypothetical protein
VQILEKKKKSKERIEILLPTIIFLANSGIISKKSSSSITA